MTTHRLSTWATLFVAITIAMLCAASATARVWTPEEFPNVQKLDSTRFVSDPEGRMSDEARRATDSYIRQLRQRTTCEVEVAVVPSTGDMTIEEWSERLFELHKPGKKDRDNGVLLVIAPDDKAVRINVGYGAEGALPDISAGKIIRRHVIPNMKRDNLDKAVAETVGAIGDALSDPAVAEELRSSQTPASRIKSLSTDILWDFIAIVAGMAFLVGLVLFCHNLRASRKRTGNYQKAVMWRSHLHTFWWISLASLGTALPFALLTLFLYRFYRTRPIKCDSCGTRMRRLGEEEDNNLLSPSQDFEEKLKTVDYDVWECPECGTVERFPFNEKQLKYSRCPKCGTMAMTLEGTVTTRQPTFHSSGEGVRIYRCKYCGHERREPFSIPRKEMPVAPVVIGGPRGRSGGGGFGGGGFGGGSYGGGGASGRW